MKKAYIIYDCKSESYSPPMLHLAVGDALRAFTQAANAQDNQIGLNPEDFSIFEIGEYDERTGIFTSYENRTHIANALDLVQSKEKAEAA